jgi:hypothetical protein
MPCLQPGLAGITSMLVRKAHRHEAAWQQYCASRDVARQQHDTAAAMAAAVLKAALDGISGDVEQQMSVLAEDKVMLLSEQQILQVRRAAAVHTGSSCLSCKQQGSHVCISFAPDGCSTSHAHHLKLLRS